MTTLCPHTLEHLAQRKDEEAAQCMMRARHTFDDIEAAEQGAMARQKAFEAKELREMKG